MKGEGTTYMRLLLLTARTLLFRSDVLSSAFLGVTDTVDSEFNTIWQPDALAPIFLLPPEVLVDVFHFLSLEEPPYSAKQNIGWIRVTHVCRLWRQVALDDSLLWARISQIPMNTEWISETLARARNAPLDIDIDLGRTSNPEVLFIFLPHISHARVLRLHGLSYIHADGFRNVCSREAPTLEHLELRAGIFPINFQDLDGTTLFNGQAPVLQTLSLSEVLIPLSLIPRGQLTRLEISLVDEISIFGVPSHGDLNQLIDLLVNSPELEDLTLHSCLPPQLADFPCHQTIYLPRLSYLGLGGSTSCITNLLKMFKIPPSTTLKLWSASENTFTQNHLLLPVISAHFQSPVLVEFKMISVTVCRKGRFLEVVASTSLPTSRVHRFQEVELFVWFEGVPEHGDWTNFIKRVCKMLHISNLEFLSICAPGKVDSVNWVEVFEGCTKVTTVQATGRGTSSLVRALSTPNTASHAHAPIFPELTFMMLMGLDFAENKPTSGILFDAVQRMVACRELKMLRIENCIIGDEHAKALRNLVPKFHWDGELSFFDNPEEDFYPPQPWWEEGFDGTI